MLDHCQSREIVTVRPDPILEVESLQGMGVENGIGSVFRSARMKERKKEG